MKILIAGSSGLVGSKLLSFLQNQGHQISILSRDRKLIDKGKIFWDPENGILDPNQIEAFDAVVNLAGENIANKRWTEEQKEKIKSSRINSTKLLSQTLAQLKFKPRVFICASAIGFYGDRPIENLHENSPPTKGDFLSETCLAWENACNPAAEAGIRVVNSRFGVILAKEGGAMSKLLLPFQLGLGGNIGNGEQFMSWIAIDDVISALNFCIEKQEISGPVNFTAPYPVTNAQFTKTLGKVLQRPTILPLPSFAAKLILGEMADALLLASAKVHCSKLKEHGFNFAYAELEPALRHILNK